MTKHSIIFIGLDTHKESTEVAYILEGRTSQPQHLGKIQTNKQAITKLVRQFQSKHPDSKLYFVYEAGPCGYWIYRHLCKLGQEYFIVAPSLIPKKPGNRVKTDKRDAIMLAMLLKNGDVDPIYVPEPEDEAVRDLSRCRESAMHDLNDAKYQLKPSCFVTISIIRAPITGHKNTCVGSRKSFFLILLNKLLYRK